MIQDLTKKLKAAEENSPDSQKVPFRHSLIINRSLLTNDANVTAVFTHLVYFILYSVLGIENIMYRCVLVV